MRGLITNKFPRPGKCATRHPNVFKNILRDEYINSRKKSIRERVISRQSMHREAIIKAWFGDWWKIRGQCRTHKTNEIIMGRGMEWRMEWKTEWKTEWNDDTGDKGSNTQQVH